MGTVIVVRIVQDLVGVLVVVVVGNSFVVTHSRSITNLG